MHTLAAAEALRMGARLGLDPMLVVDTLGQSAGAPGVLWFPAAVGGLLGAIAGAVLGVGLVMVKQSIQNLGRVLRAFA